MTQQRTAVNIPDCHIPFEDKKAYNLMLTIAKDVDNKLGLDEINIMGDFADFLNVSLHPKSVEGMSVTQTIKDEVYCVIKRLEELRALFPSTKITYIEGNHEYRLMRYITKKCPELFDLFSLPELLQFERMDIEYVPFGKSQLHRCLDTNYILRHVPFNGGKHCAAGSAHSKHVSLGFGHTHRLQTYTCTDAFKGEISCYSMGWLGDRTAPCFSYVDTDDWVHSFQIVTAFSRDNWYVDTIRIKDHKAYYNGILYIEE